MIPSAPPGKFFLLPNVKNIFRWSMAFLQWVPVLKLQQDSTDPFFANLAFQCRDFATQNLLPCYVLPGHCKNFAHAELQHHGVLHWFRKHGIPFQRICAAGPAKCRMSTASCLKICKHQVAMPSICGSFGSANSKDRVVSCGVILLLFCKCEIAAG